MPVAAVSGGQAPSASDQEDSTESDSGDGAIPSILMVGADGEDSACDVNLSKEVVCHMGDVL